MRPTPIARPAGPRWSWPAAMLVAAFAAACGASDKPTTGIVVESPRDGIWQSAESSPFTFELEQAFGQLDGPDEAMLGGIAAATVDDDGNVYILDDSPSRLVSFDAQGRFRWSVGQEGPGPGEFSYAASIVWDGNGLLYVGNQGGRRIDRYDTDGRLIDSHETKSLGLEGSIALRGFRHADTLLATSRYRGEYAQLAIVLAVANDWRVARTFVMRDSLNMDPDAARMVETPTAFDTGYLTTGSMGAYRLRRFDSYGRVDRIAVRDIELFPPVAIKENRGNSLAIRTDLFAQLTYLGRVADVHLARLDWASRVTDPTAYIAGGERDDPGWRRSIDYFDSNWRLLYSQEGAESSELGPPGSFVTVDGSGRMYARLPDGVQLGRYRMIVANPSG